MSLTITNTLQEFAKYYRDSMRKELPDLVTRPPALRVSGFPFCGLKTLYYRLEGKQEKFDSGKEFYCSVGTAAHLVFQRWLGNKGRVYGNWKCRDKECGNFEEFSATAKCPDCGKEREYEEFTVKAFKHVSGHLDGVWKASDGKYYVIDYKTSSSKNLWAHRKRSKIFPYVKNKIQIMSYCALIEHTHDIKIAGWILVYVARDNPMDFEPVMGTVTAKRKAAIYRRIEHYDKVWDVLQRFKKKDLQFIIDNKDCKDHDYYLEYQKGMEGCPLAPVCFTKQLKPVMLDLIDEKL